MKNYLGTAILVAVASTSILLDSCNYDNEDNLFPEVIDTTTIDTMTVDTTMSFASDIKPLMVTNCANSPSCHASGTSNPVLETYDQISGLQARIKARAIDEKTMPPSGPLDQDKLDDIQQWIDEGAENN